MKIYPPKQWEYIDEVVGDLDLIEERARPHDSTARVLKAGGKAYLCCNASDATMYGRLAAIEAAKVKRP